MVVRTTHSDWDLTRVSRRLNTYTNIFESDLTLESHLTLKSTSYTNSLTHESAFIKYYTVYIALALRFSHWRRNTAKIELAADLSSAFSKLVLTC